MNNMNKDLMWNRLKNELLWVQIVYQDSSCILIYTTLNKDICRDKGVTLYADSLFDFSRNKYIPFDLEATEINIMESKPEIGEVNEFVNQFL